MMTKIKDISNTNETDITSNLKKIDTNIKDISNNTNNITNFKKMNTILNETYTISEKSSIVNLDNKFANKGILKIKANYDNNFSKIYTFRNNNDTFKSITQIGTNFDEFEIDAVDSSNIKISITLVDDTIESYNEYYSN